MIDQYVIGGAQAGNPMQTLHHSPLIMAMLGLVFSYYALYALGVLRWCKAQAVPALPPAAA